MKFSLAYILTGFFSVALEILNQYWIFLSILMVIPVITVAIIMILIKHLEKRARDKTSGSSVILWIKNLTHFFNFDIIQNMKAITTNSFFYFWFFSSKEKGVGLSFQK